MKFNIFGKRKQVLLYIGAFVLIFVAVNFFYYLNFHGSGISKSTAVWGEYGSYISGVTSVFNLIVFIFLTVYVARLGNANSRKQLKTQKKILLAQFRQTELFKWKERLEQFDKADYKDLEIY